MMTYLFIASRMKVLLEIMGLLDQEALWRLRLEISISAIIMKMHMEMILKFREQTKFHKNHENFRPQKFGATYAVVPYCVENLYPKLH